MNQKEVEEKISSRSEESETLEDAEVDDLFDDLEAVK